MRWQLRRGVLRPAFPGSPWWRAVNERILRDGCEAVALSGGLSGPPSSHAVARWLDFAHRPTAAAWYRAHNGSVVAAYLEHRDLAEAENEPERFFMNVILCRVLYTHALVAAPRISLGRLRARTVARRPPAGHDRDLPAALARAPGPVSVAGQCEVLPRPGARVRAAAEITRDSGGPPDSSARPTGRALNARSRRALWTVLGNI